MAKQDKSAVFSKFSLKAMKQKRSQKQAIKQAQEFSRRMEESKKKARQDFLNKLMINAAAMNDAREDWEDKEEENTEC
ncbi:MAG: hypothetical protein IJE43_14650 [Alphaproteobacteria bacterium]|nr:hypothetical protein [Alphaproteobacteria bacterium]